MHLLSLSVSQDQIRRIRWEWPSSFVPLRASLLWDSQGLANRDTGFWLSDSNAEHRGASDQWTQHPIQSLVFGFDRIDNFWNFWLIYPLFKIPHYHYQLLFWMINQWSFYSIMFLSHFCYRAETPLLCNWMKSEVPMSDCLPRQRSLTQGIKPSQRCSSLVSGAARPQTPLFVLSSWF